MAYTNKTTNYELPQYIGTDKPSYLNDFNFAMNTIDAQMKTNANSASSASSEATVASNKVGDLSNLTTTDKSNVVNAINEIKTEEGTIETILNKMEIHGKFLERNSDGGNAQTISASTHTYITNYSNSKINQFNNNEITYDALTGAFTVNSPDITHLLINAQVFIQTATTMGIYLDVTRNGSEYSEYQYTATANENRHEFSYFVEVSQGDSIKIAVYTPSSNSVRAQLNNFVQIIAF